MAKKTISEVIKNIKDSVVNIQTPDSLGAGFIIDKRGLIVTNAHVIGRNINCVVEFPDKKEYPGKILVSYRFRDIAFISVKTKKKMKGLELRADKSYSVGDSVIAFGNPLGFGNTVTKGIISTKSREIEGKEYIQTDVAINPGNSGGPLIDEKGRVIGINTLKIVDASGIGFAIPLHRVSDVISEIRNNFDKLVNRAYCPVCGTSSSKRRKYCKKCGAVLIKTEKEKKKKGKNQCPVCGFKNEPDSVYCENCGSQLKEG